MLARARYARGENFGDFRQKCQNAQKRRKIWRFSSKVSKATRRQKSSKWSKALELLAEANISQKWSKFSRLQNPTLRLWPPELSQTKTPLVGDETVVVIN